MGRAWLPGHHRINAIMFGPISDRQLPSPLAASWTRKSGEEARAEHEEQDGGGVKNSRNPTEPTDVLGLEFPIHGISFCEPLGQEKDGEGGRGVELIVLSGWVL